MSILFEMLQKEDGPDGEARFDFCAVGQDGQELAYYENVELYSYTLAAEPEKDGWWSLCLKGDIPLEQKG